MPNDTKPIAIRPNRHSDLQRVVDEAREAGKPISPIIHELVAKAVRKDKRK